MILVVCFLCRFAFAVGFSSFSSSFFLQNILVSIESMSTTSRQKDLDRGTLFYIYLWTNRCLLPKKLTRDDRWLSTSMDPGKSIELPVYLSPRPLFENPSQTQPTKIHEFDFLPRPLRIDIFGEEHLCWPSRPCCQPWEPGGRPCRRVLSSWGKNTLFKKKMWENNKGSLSEHAT